MTIANSQYYKLNIQRNNVMKAVSHCKAVAVKWPPGSDIIKHIEKKENNSPRFLQG